MGKLSENEIIVKYLVGELIAMEPQHWWFFTSEIYHLKALEILNMMQFYIDIEEKNGNNRTTTETAREGLLERKEEPSN